MATPPEHGGGGAVAAAAAAGPAPPSPPAPATSQIISLNRLIIKQLLAKQGCIFSSPPPPLRRGGQKYELLAGLGRKYDYLLRKSANIRGNRWTNGKKGEIFTVPRGKNFIFGKRGEGKISYFG